MTLYFLRKSQSQDSTPFGAFGDPIRILALAADIALITILALWNAANPWLAAAVAAPLFLPLPGLWRARAYTYAWTSLLVLVYLVFLITEFWVSPERGYAGAALLAAGALFVACLLFRGKAGA